MMPIAADAATDLFWASLSTALGFRGHSAPRLDDATVQAALRLAEKEHLDALCAEGLTILGVDEAKSDRKARVHKAAVRSMLLHRDRRTLEDAFRRAAIPYVLLKGAVSDALFFQGSGLRGTSDIDLLIAPEATPRAHDILVEKGWQTSDSDPHRPPTAKPERLYQSPAQDRFDVDLHVRVGKSPPYGDATTEILSRAIDVETSLGSIRALSSEDQLLFAAVNQAGQKMLGSTRLAIDAAMLIRAGVNLSHVVERAREFGCGWALYGILRLVDQRLGCAVPCQVLRDAEPRSLRRRLADRVAGVRYAPWLPSSAASRLLLVETPLVGDVTWPARAIARALRFRVLEGGTRVT